MLQVNLLVVGMIHSQNNKFLMGVNMKVTSSSKLTDNNNPAGGFTVIRLKLRISCHVSHNYF